ncbi:16S rRNA (uracil(1498)-N(3))-methyltransferase [Sneathiella sp.]|uniref:16S rRNA (uracil(1498)-N(3))-methyltransferase n=1 Tax=Sneathiella sp. TaxID=1964365 RepID=UPI0039E5FEB6
MAPKISSVRLYVEASLGLDAGIILDRPQAHYVGNVMRKQVGDPVVLFNGRDGEWLGELQEVRKNHALVHVKSCLREQTPEPDIILYFAPLKKIPTALVVQKATELGASQLSPVQTTRTNADKIRDDKMVLQAIEAAEQSERLSVPEIRKLEKLSTVLKHRDMDRPLIFCNERLDKKAPLEQLADLKNFGKWAVLIGPEGGFSEEEVSQIMASENVHAIGLGPRILRAETAVMASLTLLQAVCGDWN